MQDSKLDNILIDKYLANSLSDEERELFDQRMKMASFAEDVEVMLAIKRAATSEGRTKLRKMLEETHATGGEQRRKFSFWKPVMLFILLALAGYGIWMYSKSVESPSSEELFIAYYEKLPNMIAPTVRTKLIRNEALNAIESAMSAYENGNFERALAIMDTIVSENDRISIYRALSNLELNRMDLAENQLDIISLDEKAQYHQTAQWFLALTYLKEYKIAEAQKQLELISKTKGHLYGKLANSLLEELH